MSAETALRELLRAASRPGSSSLAQARAGAVRAANLCTSCGAAGNKRYRLTDCKCSGHTDGGGYPITQCINAAAPERLLERNGQQPWDVKDPGQALSHHR